MINHVNKLTPYDMGRYAGISDRQDEYPYDDNNAFTPKEYEEFCAGYKYGYTFTERKGEQ